MANQGRDLLHRYEGNPLIELEDIPFKCNTVFNAGAIKIGDTYRLLIRVENLRGQSVFLNATGSDGHHFDIAEFPSMFPAEDGPWREFETLGIEDPRLTELEGAYYVTYTAVSPAGPVLALARTTDFEHFERLGVVSLPPNKDGILFPRKVGGRYVRFDRPMVGDMGNIWVSYSEDLKYWGDPQLVMTPRGHFWDSHRIGASATPFETDRGWLEIYHGVKFTAAGPIYRLGTVLLERENPAKVLGRSVIPILVPRETYERLGDVGNVVFSCGCVLEDDGEVKVYYGAADTCICLAAAPLKELLDACTAVD